VNSKRFVLLASLLFLLGGCENEIDINAPYKEVPFVVGLLDASEDEQFIRIQKAYQNSVSQTTEQGAQYPDSLYFDTLVVTVRNIRNGGEPIHEFRKTYEVPKESGFFTTGGHHVYKSINFKPDIFGEYELTIFNPKSGQTYQARTEIVEPTTMKTGAFYGLAPYSLIGRPIITIEKRGTRSAIQDSYLRFYYQEFPLSNQSQIDTLYIDYYLERGVTVDFAFSQIRPFLVPRSFYDFLLVNIPNKSNVGRRYIGLERRTATGSQFLKDVIELNKDNGGFIDKKRDYSNLSNGAQGIFSSRAKSSNMIELVRPGSFDSIPIFLNQYKVPQFIYP
jgi:hypothetical protein